MKLSANESLDTARRAVVLQAALPEMVRARDDVERRLENIEAWFVRFGRRRERLIRSYFPLMKHERARLRAKLRLADRVLGQVNTAIGQDATT
jgi:hypothetical protein